MSEWQPIESAPRDGTQILAWDGGVMATVEWRATFRCWYLLAPGSYAESGEFDLPTHWMPLPDPPKEVE